MIVQNNAQLYARAKEVFFEALDVEIAEQAKFVQMKCVDDAELQYEVESLLAARSDAQSFLESSVLKILSQHESLQNRIISGYRLIKELGNGGMGIVYLAEKIDAEFVRQVALKIVKNSLHSETFFKRLKRERQI